MEIKIDEGAEFIIKTINDNGFEAFVVGGCVRDSIMGRIPNDWDITTNAKAEDIIKIFERTIPTGLKHGTITVLIEKNQYEVTTYRIDGEYIDMRRPENVTFSENLEDDLSRRDFSINAMAYNNTVGLVDRFNGKNDINRKIIACVGEPDKRFNEDALRILRAIRFSAKLNFDIEDRTFQSMKKNSINIKKVSFERIKSEIDGILLSDPMKLKLLNQINISDWIFEGLVIEDTDLELGEKILKEKNVDNNLLAENSYLKQMIIAVIFNKAKNNDLEDMLKRLRYSNKEIKSILSIQKVYNNEEYSLLSDEKLELDSKRILLKKIFRELNDIELVKTAIYSKFIQKKENLSLCFCLINDIIESGECFSISQLKVNGRDLIENGLANGSEIGNMLDELLNKVIVNPELNDKDLLLDFIRKRKFN